MCDLRLGPAVGHRARRLRLVLAAPLVALGCSQFAGTRQQYTLYRNSLLDGYTRIHVASFDAMDSDDYNRSNCQIAQELFQAQPGVRTRFWCERGAFRR